MTEKEKDRLIRLETKFDDFVDWAKSNRKSDCAQQEQMKAQIDRQGNELSKFRGIGIAIVAIFGIIEAWFKIHRP